MLPGILTKNLFLGAFIDELGTFEALVEDHVGVFFVGVQHLHVSLELGIEEALVVLFFTHAEGSSVVTEILGLHVNSKILVINETNGWVGPFMLKIQGHAFPNIPIDLRRLLLVSGKLQILENLRML